MTAQAYLDVLRERVLVFDGAMGTNLQDQSLTAEDFGGARYEGCMDALCITRPTAPGAVHRDFLSAGCDVVETNTFQASRLRLSEWGLADQTYEINRAGAQIARRWCDEFAAAENSARTGEVEGVNRAGVTMERNAASWLDAHTSTKS